MIKISNTTLVAVSSIKIDETINALIQSMNDIEYDDIILISHEKPSNLPSEINFKKCNKLKTIDDYNYFMLFELCNYIETNYVIVVQHDGYVLRPNKWLNEFYDYDYIGAPWPKNLHYTKEGVNIRVGNGGFSFRSKKLLNILNTLNLSFTDNGTGFYNEDGVICNYYRKILEDNGIKFASAEIASKFSYELNCDETVDEPFGFHKHKK